MEEVRPALRVWSGPSDRLAGPCGRARDSGRWPPKEWGGSSSTAAWGRGTEDSAAPGHPLRGGKRPWRPRGAPGPPSSSYIPHSSLSSPPPLGVRTEARAGVGGCVRPEEWGPRRGTRSGRSRAAGGLTSGAARPGEDYTTGVAEDRRSEAVAGLGRVLGPGAFRARS
ncbi:hypothetical protein NDU88_005725 [Pleurodeles waltl]|uniref:Uncharacterized protein n=1 Tax=Pleurodeles waltl TaxID=8319 RepID=A0AAV7WCP3_PLEWA|nr:hypothetical protein NDU88_005725 [Pleurodeles waltl]